jgi:hypothetical protein
MDLKGVSPATGGPGLVRRLLDLFRGRGKKARKAAVPAVDRTPFRQRSADLLREVQGARGGDAAARLAVLRAVIDRIEDLFKDLVAAGDRHPVVQRLGEVVLEMRAFLMGTALPDVAVRSLWGRTEAALRDWLALEPEPPAVPPEPQREGFWK